MCELHKHYPLVHLHLHTDQSSLDGCGHIKDYVKLAKEHNHPAIAITDHGNPGALFRFYKECKANNIKPILGLEFYIAKDLSIQLPSKQRAPGFEDGHQSILIADKEGYKNYCKLTYLANQKDETNAYYYKPRISTDMLIENNKGLIITTSCIAGLINRAITRGDHKGADDLFKEYLRVFGDRMVGEIQFNELTDKSRWGINQKETDDYIIRLCNKYNVPIIIGGDVHYAFPGDDVLQDTLIKSRRSNVTSDEMETTETKEEMESDSPATIEEDAPKKKEEFQLHARNLFYHNAEDYLKFNKEWGYGYDDKFLQECLDNSVKLADKVDFNLISGETHLPIYKPTERERIDLKLTKEADSNEILKEKAYKGLFEKLQVRIDRGEVFSEEKLTEYENRLEYELGIIKKQGFADYFLIVSDNVVWAKANGIMVGAGRGSGAGSLVCYGIDITTVDPIEFGLMFERFLNIFRTDMPDLDLDYMEGGREKVREYLENKWGKDSVFGVATFGTFSAKSAIQSMARGLGMDTSFTGIIMNKISKLDKLEEVKASDFKTYFKNIADTTTDIEIKEWIMNNEKLLSLSERAIDQVKNIGTHAGGIVVTPGPVYNYIPVIRAAKEIVTAFRESGSFKELQEMGLLKLDILGLATLNVIQGCINDIKKYEKVDITNDILFPNLNDAKVLDTFKKGDLFWIFQMDKVHEFLKVIDVDSFEDINAINSINRPGPKETFTEFYGKWKKLIKAGKVDECKDDVIFPMLDFMQKATEETYHTLIYQEQFMNMVSEASGLGLGFANDMRKAIGVKPDHPNFKKVEPLMKKMEDGMIVNGYKKEEIDYFVQYCRDFSGYSFNKSHSVCYSIIAWQTLYLKTYWRKYFYKNIFNIEDWENYPSIISECRKYGVEVLPLDVAYSKVDFTIEGDAIRMGFKAAKGFGNVAANELNTLELDKCKTLAELLSKPFKKINSKNFKALNGSGAFDRFGEPREKVQIMYDLIKNKSVQMWFLRKRKALTLETMPDELKIFKENKLNEAVEKVKLKENPWIELIHELASEIPFKANKKTEQKLEQEILGFSFKMINTIANVRALLEKSGIDIKSISERNDREICWYMISKKTKALTKTGKPYWKLVVTDGKGDFHVKCWDLLPLEEGGFYASSIKSDLYGMTLDKNTLETIEIE